MNKPTDAECHMQKILDSLGFEVKSYPQKTIIDRLNCVYSQMPFKGMHLDFALEKAKIAIEVNGDYWHGVRSTKLNFHQIKRKMGDATKQQVLSKNGWSLLQFAASDLKRKNIAIRIQEHILLLLDV